MLQQHGFQECSFFPPDDSSIFKNDTKSIRDLMEYEGARLSTFATFPDIPGLYATKLAGAGFYYLDKDDKVRCFKCKIIYKNWKPNDSPIKIHLQISPLCDFIKHIGSKYSEHSQHISDRTVSNGTRNISHVRTECDQTSHDTHKLPVNRYNPQISLHMLTGGTDTQRIQANSINQNSNNFRRNDSNSYGGRVQTNPCVVNQSLNNTTDNIARTEAYQIPNNYSTNDTNSLIRIPQTDLETLNRNLSTPNQQSSGHITTTNRSSNAAVGQPMMGICVDNPKYSKYATRGSRLDSFKYWPTYLTQSPDEMATAGFFFTGSEDHCRCFFCGGGLKNWEPGDEPWVEHARWYQQCAFLRSCKGEKFIEIVQTNVYRYVPAEIVEQSKLPSSKKDLAEFKDIPAVRSVTEFGYDEKLVREAYETLQKSGKSDITTTGLLETIFSLEEKHTHENSNYNQQPLENSQSVKEPAKIIAKQITNEATSDQEPELSVRSLEEENQNLKDQQTCKICLDEPIAIVFLPCGHLAACGSCAPALRRCPICRAFIKGTVKAIMC